jgi:hypothetical protein
MNYDASCCDAAAVILCKKKPEYLLDAAAVILCKKYLNIYWVLLLQLV